jgi:hypothetical protein
MREGAIAQKLAGVDQLQLSGRHHPPTRPLRLAGAAFPRRSDYRRQRFADAAEVSPSPVCGESDQPVMDNSGFP